MDNLNNIPNVGNWGDAASKLNDNFNKVKQAVTTVENVSKNNKGYFSSLSALNTAFPSPKAGQTAYVYDEASSTNYYIYNAVNGAWASSTVEAPSVGVDIAGYTKTGGSTKTLKEVDDEVAQLVDELGSEIDWLSAFSNNRASIFSKNERYTKGTGELKNGGSYNTTDFIDIDFLKGFSISYNFPTGASVNAVSVFSEGKVYIGNIQEVSLLKFDSVLELYSNAKYIRLSCKPEDFNSFKIHQSNVELKKDIDKIKSRKDNFTNEIILNKTYYPGTELYDYDGRFVLAEYIPISFEPTIVVNNGIRDLTLVRRFVDKDLQYLGTTYTENAKYVKVAVVVEDSKKLEEDDLIGFTITINDSLYSIIDTSLFYELSLDYKEKDSVNALLSSNPLNAFVEKKTYYKVSDGTKSSGPDVSYNSTMLLPIEQLKGLQLSYEHPSTSPSNKISVFDINKHYLGNSTRVNISSILGEYTSAYYIAFSISGLRNHTIESWYSKFPRVYDEGVEETFGNESFVQGGFSKGQPTDSETRIRINEAIYVGVGSRVLVNVPSGYESVIHFMNSETEYGGSFEGWRNKQDFISSYPLIKIAVRKSGNPIITPTENISLTLETFELMLDDLVGKEEFQKEIDNLNPAPKVTPPLLAAKIFRRVGCIGDSYTAGYIKLTSETLPNNTYPLWSWVHYMKNLTGETWENWGKGGSTSKGWVEGAANLHLVKAEGNKCQAYVIGLMINDLNSSMPYYTPVGVISDIGTDNDTYYAYYYKLIKECVDVNAEAKIFCNTCPKDGSNYELYNQAVRDVVSYCYNTEGLNVYLCDLASEKYMTEEYYGNPVFEDDLIYGHYSPIGYEFMAECFLKVMSNVIMENLKDFQNVFLIPYDEA